jgi:sRNA-binding regulator protein Hfq
MAVAAANLSIILNQIKNELHEQEMLVGGGGGRHHGPALIYIGVGTRAGLIRYEDGILEDKNYHQFPPFLQNLENVVPNLQMYLILIDPIQENPPYLVHDKGFQPVMNMPNSYIKAAGGYKGLQINKNKTTVHVLRESVHTEPYETYTASPSTDITRVLRDLNTFAKNHSVTTLYHDFTGKANHVLAEFFDPEIGGQHLDHIIYGFCGRAEQGCYIDLSVPEASFPFYIENNHMSRPMLKFFNIYQFIELDSLHTINSCERIKYNSSDLINRQQEQVVENMLLQLRNQQLAVLRFLVQILAGEEKITEFANFNFLPKLLQKSALEYYHARDFRALYDYILTCFSKPINVAAKIRQLDLNGREILECIIADKKNIYDWFKNASLFF